MSGEGLVTEYSFNNDIIRSRATSSSSSRTICNFLISQPAGARSQGQMNEVYWSLIHTSALEYKLEIKFGKMIREESVWIVSFLTLTRQLGDCCWGGSGG